jgi:hypothetical protein
MSVGINMTVILSLALEHRRQHRGLVPHRMSFRIRIMKLEPCLHPIFLLPRRRHHSSMLVGAMERKRFTTPVSNSSSHSYFLSSQVCPDSKHVKEPSLGLGKLVQTEIDFRKKESLGLAPTQSARKLGSGVPKKGAGVVETVGSRGDGNRQGQVLDRSQTLGGSWGCLVCTL